MSDVEQTAIGVAETLDEVVYWNGRRVDDLTRDELLVAVKQACRDLHAAYASQKRTHEMYAFLNQAREARYRL
jgi:hypothetical protein